MKLDEQQEAYKQELALSLPGYEFVNKEDKSSLTELVLRPGYIVEWLSKCFPCLDGCAKAKSKKVIWLSWSGRFGLDLSSAIMEHTVYPLVNSCRKICRPTLSKPEGLASVEVERNLPTVDFANIEYQFIVSRNELIQALTDAYTFNDELIDQGITTLKTNLSSSNFEELLKRG